MTDEQLILKIREDKSLFEDLINRYQDKIFTTTYKFTHNYDEANDLSQEIFLKIYKNINNFKFNSKVSTWIYRISINTCIDFNKKTRKFKFFSFTNENKDLIEKNTIDSTDISHSLIEKEDNQLIHNAISNLSDKYKTVVILYHFNQLSYEEISNILNIPKKTVETRLYRARKNLKLSLKKLGFGGESVEVH